MLDLTNIRNIIIVLATCCLFTFAITFYIKKIAVHVGALDIPNARKVHTKPMPRLGGLGIFLGFLFGYMLFGKHSIQMNSILIGSFIIVMVGIIDDIKPIGAKTKLLGQILAACVVIFYGNIFISRINFLTLNLELGYFGYLITLIFILGCINIINLIDGLDGLSSGTCAIFYTTIIIISSIKGDPVGLTISLALIMLGSTLGFLIHNFYPASIFSGDSGSMFQGFMIAVISILGFKTVALITFFVPLLILGIPILDTLFAIIRRLIKKQPVFLPDKSHLHHQLLALGLSHKNTVLAIYAMNILFATSAVIYILRNKTLGIISYIVIFILISWIVLKTSIIADKKNK